MSLGEMTLRLCSGQTQSKCPVPPGFVVLASAFDKFLKDTDAIVEENAMLDRIDIKSAENIEDQAEIMRDVILKKKFPGKLGKEILSVFDKLDQNTWRFGLRLLLKIQKLMLGPVSWKAIFM